MQVLRAHILPLTNCAFNKAGDKFITGSYDRTCKVWDTASGDELLALEGHKNVVYAIAFNNPFGDKIVTGSFDKTAKVWDAESGKPMGSTAADGPFGTPLSNNTVLPFVGHAFGAQPRSIGAKLQAFALSVV